MYDTTTADNLDNPSFLQNYIFQERYINMEAPLNLNHNFQASWVFVHRGTINILRWGMEGTEYLPAFTWKIF